MNLEVYYKINENILNSSISALSSIYIGGTIGVKSNLLLGLVCLLLLLSVPAIITIFYNEQSTVDQEDKKGIEISIRLEETGQVINLDLEEYIIGVVAAEMPASYNLEALKAQAVAARTYAYRKIITGTEVLSSDFRKGQAYLSNEQLKERWGNEHYNYLKKISEAVYTTKGQILVYNDEPIEAVFHAISAGKTQSSLDLWGFELPYLVSVESEQDIDAPSFFTEYIFSEEEVKNKLKANYSDLTLSVEPLVNQMQIVRKNEAEYIQQIQIGNKVITGEEFRHALSLKSSNFTIKQKDEDLFITTKGYGHGAGMSQYGANELANANYKYDDILKHYYIGAKIKTLK